MRIHVFEFIGGGGLARAELAPLLAREGDLMCAAIVDDLLELPGVEVSYSRDPRLGPLAPARPGARLDGSRELRRDPSELPGAAYAREIRAARAVWPIAPETGGELLRAAQAVLDAGRMLLGPRPDAIALASSKSATARALERAGISCVPCFAAGEAVPARPGAWVVKPDDGAGCQDTTVLPGHREAVAALAAAAPGFIAQPWIEGDAMSLAVVAGPGTGADSHGAAEVLSVNRQRLRLHRGGLELRSLEVNAAPVTGELQRLAAQVVRAIPGLAGCFGIDFVATQAGPVVVEVNPRVTTAVAGLRDALGVNVAARVLAAAGGLPSGLPSGGPAARSAPSRPVLLDLGEAADG